MAYCHRQEPLLHPERRPCLSFRRKRRRSSHQWKGVSCGQVRYARICTSKVDFINRLRGLSIRLRQQGFDTNLLQKSFNKFFSCHGLIVEKYGAALRGMRLAIQAWIAPSYPYITYLLLSVVFQFYLGRCARTILFWARALFVYLFDVYIKFIY